MFTLAAFVSPTQTIDRVRRPGAVGGAMYTLWVQPLSQRYVFLLPKIANRCGVSLYGIVFFFFSQQERSSTISWCWRSERSRRRGWTGCPGQGSARFPSTVLRTATASSRRSRSSRYRICCTSTVDLNTHPPLPSLCGAFCYYYCCSLPVEKLSLSYMYHRQRTNDSAVSPSFKVRDSLPP